MGYISGTGSHCCRHCSSIYNILQQNTVSVISIRCRGSVVKLLPMICKVLGSIPDGYIFESD